MTRLIIPAPISSRPQPAAVLELLKPIIWFAPMWAYGCGVVSSGQPLASHLPQIALGILLAGPPRLRHESGGQRLV